MGGPDYILDISSAGTPSAPPASAGKGGNGATDSGPGGQASRRPWLAIRWRCCAVYSRIYRDPEAKTYEGRCPNCGRPLTIAVGPGGTNCRFFDAQ